MELNKNQQSIVSTSGASLLNSGLGFFLFMGFFALYLHTAAPHVAPYRDSGEMVSLLTTLSVAHPPGYPVYTLVGHVATWIPLGNVAYRTNLFSAFCAALALVFLFYGLLRVLDPLPSLIAAVAFGFSNPFWELATVSEMYTFGIFWFCFVLWAVLSKQKVPFIGFLLALGLGIRMDLMLVIPILLLTFWMTRKSEIRFGVSTLFFFIGLCVFSYLLIRSRQNPVIDWGNPDTLLAVINSMTRKSYSGTLDLLSLSYQRGENFPVNMRLYATHLFKAFGLWGCLAMGIGAWHLYKRDRALTVFLGGILVVTGPLFLFLANMPPNPHALAIVEAAYPLPDLMCAIAIGFGLQWFMGWIRWKRIAAVCLAFLFFSNSMWGYSRADKRDNFYLRDYVENVFRSAPRNAVVVFHKDVQLFALWEAQLVERRRPDISLISSGLSGSPWYWEMKKRWGTAACPEQEVKTAEGWPLMKRAVGSRALVVGHESELALLPGLKFSTRGMVTEIIAANDAGGPGRELILPDLCLYRGGGHYGETSDFFSTDLIGDAARAHQRMGYELMMEKKFDAADWYFKRAECLDPTFFRPASDRGYMYFLEGRYNDGVAAEQIAIRKGLRMLELAEDFKSLPDVVDGLKSDLANAYLFLGASYEKTGALDAARTAYQNSIGVIPTAQAEYNLAVTFWGRDWVLAVEHLRRAVQLNPHMNEARHYLDAALAKVKSR